MILRIEGDTAPLYDPIQDASKISIKVNHNGVVKHHSRRHYVGGLVQFIDYVDISEMQLSHFKTMAEICGYDNESVAFWHKYGRLDSYVGVDVEATFNEGQKSDIPSEHQESIGASADYSSSADDFEDLDNDFEDENDLKKE